MGEFGPFSSAEDGDAKLVVGHAEDGSRNALRGVKFTPSLRQVYAKFTPSLRQVYAKFTPSLCQVYAKFTPSLRMPRYPLSWN